MEDILRKLYEIESTASKIMDDVLSQKQELAQQMEDEMKAFDEAANLRVQKQLEETRSRLEAENKVQLENLVVQTDATVSKMESYYQEHHEQLAQELLETIIRK